MNTLGFMNCKYLELETMKRKDNLLGMREVKDFVCTNENIENNKCDFKGCQGQCPQFEPFENGKHQIGIQII